MKCCEERGGIQREVTSFVLPLGSTVNMDGTACYEAIGRSLACFFASVNYNNQIFESSCSVYCTSAWY